MGLDPLAILAHDMTEQELRYALTRVTRAARPIRLRLALARTRNLTAGLLAAALGLALLAAPLPYLARALARGSTVAYAGAVLWAWAVIGAARISRRGRALARLAPRWFTQVERLRRELTTHRATIASLHARLAQRAAAGAREP